MSNSASVSVLIAMLAANLPGRFVPAIISDRCIGPLNTLIPACILSSIMFWLWTGVTTSSALFVVACLYGFVSAGIQSLFSVTAYSFSLGEDLVGQSVRQDLDWLLMKILGNHGTAERSCLPGD